MPSMMLLKFLPGYSPKDKTFDSLTHYSVINIKEGLAKTFLFFFFFQLIMISIFILKKCLIEPCYKPIKFLFLLRCMMLYSSKFKCCDQSSARSAWNWHQFSTQTMVQFTVLATTSRTFSKFLLLSLRESTS